MTRHSSSFRERLRDAIRELSGREFTASDLHPRLPFQVDLLKVRHDLGCMVRDGQLRIVRYERPASAGRRRTAVYEMAEFPSTDAFVERSHEAAARIEKVLRGWHA